ncbi:TrkA family potassium uptake protein [Brachybacterium sp. EF45031]|uniref:potassium channel family protein n=1 Tax=Brachybacterium sillae TaxID=2810536 RepID=UPI00217E0859|nr:TrkA family potassium uptake protein [Brachybacterium sillae]MCS6710518.1 TrkA family potassium uptake protein [Brachybacterium sillae]
MRIVVIGAGAVGRSVARELLAKGHRVALVDRDADEARRAKVPEAEWFRGDAAELHVLADARLETAEVMVAATGDDKVNLVVSLLARTEFGVPRTVARVNHPANEWMYDSTWGVDVAVSTPRIMTALVEEAVSVGRAVPLFSFAGSSTRMLEITLPDASPMVGRTVGSVPWPSRCVLVGIIRDGQPQAPTRHDVLEADDELLFLATVDDTTRLERLLVPEEVEASTDALPVLRRSEIEEPPEPVA